jgi:diguanylate cyclase (GGDEF)-like protein
MNKWPRWALTIRETGFAYLVLIVTVMLAALASSFAKNNVQTGEYKRFNEAIQITSAALRQRIATYTDALYGATALFNASEIVTRQEFQSYVKTIRLEEHYPGIQSLGFIRRVRPEELPSYVKQLREQQQANPCGYPDFSFFPRNTQTEYFLVQLVEPIAQNKAMFGKEIMTDPACRAAMERARDSGKPSATRRIDLVRAGKETPGFMLILPIFDPKMRVDTVEERRQALTGFVFGNFIVVELFSGIFGKQVLPRIDVDFEVFDNGEINQEHLLYDDDTTLRALGDLRESSLVHIAKIEVGGRDWTLFFAARPDFHDTFSNRLPMMILGGGLLLGIALFHTSQTQTKHLVERRKHLTELEKQATHDSLTGMLNRDYLYTYLREVLSEDKRHGENAALLMIDLDGFKEINDTLGHHSGDLLLRQIGPRLQPLLRPTDTLARLGGDEFALWMTPIYDGQSALVKVQSILEEIRKPFMLDDITVRIDASIGVALYPEHGRDTSALMRCADVAMYVAKKNNRGFAVYDAAHDLHSPRRLSLLSQLGQAIEQNQLVLHYQPKIRIKDKCVIGLEALVRWQHPTEGLLPPGDFIPEAEASAIIRPLTLWVIDHALGQRQQWHEGGLTTNVAVNISARNLLDIDLPEKIADLLEKHGVDSNCLELEITESALIADPDLAYAVLTKLHSYDVRISIDDFGTGYSSLAYLKKLPISTLKVDLSFVTDMTENDNDAVIVHSTVKLAHNLGLNVVAEGVESRETLDLLEIIDCDYAQGYFLSRPLPVEKITAWLKQAQLVS